MLGKFIITLLYDCHYFANYLLFVTNLSTVILTKNQLIPDWLKNLLFLSQIFSNFLLFNNLQFFVSTQIERPTLETFRKTTEKVSYFMTVVKPIEPLTVLKVCGQFCSDLRYLRNFHMEKKNKGNKTNFKYP